MAVAEHAITLPDDRTLHAYATAGDAGAGWVLWHHGTPNVGAPPEPLFAEAERLGLRWFSYDRPGYGGSTEHRGRTVASAAGDAAAVADALGIDRFATMGHSGGGPHALACAALLGDRVTAAVSVSGLAPPDATGLDWYAGMIPSGVAALRAAEAGRAAKERFEAEHGDDYDGELTEGDLDILAGSWSWLESVVTPALGAPGAIDDDLAYVTPWSFDPAGVGAPAFLLHGDRDGIVPASHSRWLADQLPDAILEVTPGDGHLSVLDRAPIALRWLAEHV